MERKREALAASRTTDRGTAHPAGGRAEDRPAHGLPPAAGGQARGASTRERPRGGARVRGAGPALWHADGGAAVLDLFRPAARSVAPGRGGSSGGRRGGRGLRKLPRPVLRADGPPLAARWDRPRAAGSARARG